MCKMHIYVSLLTNVCTVLQLCVPLSDNGTYMYQVSLNKKIHCSFFLLQISMPCVHPFHVAIIAPVRHLELRSISL